jgi:mannose-6-phosphate isomerase-like protein (cupin superfamily)
VNRIVTGLGGDGKPAVLFEGTPPTVVDFGKYVTTELWVTGSTPPAMNGTEDRSTRPWELEPPPGGNCFRIVRIAPDGGDADPPAVVEEAGADFLEAHATATLDYVTVLSGEVTLIVGDREIDLLPGDSVVQQGVDHDWQNRGTEPCVLVGVLVSAAALP